MTKKKSILIVYPHNIFKPQMGIDSRFLELVKYFKSKNFIIDIVALKNFVSAWEEESYINQELVDNIYFYDFSDGYNKVNTKTGKKKFKLFFFKKKVLKRIKNKKFPELPDYAFFEMQEMFNSLLKKTSYDYILISYVYWAKLIENNKRIKGKKILDLSDFTTLILSELSSGDLNLGKVFEEEVRRINCFNHVLSISFDEMWLFSQFAKLPKYNYLPHFIESKKAYKEKKYDILILGSDNQFNIDGIKWFLEYIHPKLSTSLKIFAVGKITKYMDERNNIEKIVYIKDLNEVYKSSKLLVAPLLGGTGLKIKVIETLSYGIPVVTTSNGVIGFKDKRNNGCLVSDDPEEFVCFVEQLLNNEKFYLNQCKNAQEYFMNNFEKKKNYEILDKVFC